jgi:hypothetical protein
MHSAWDTAHHLRGHELLSFVPGSSFGCAICDAVLATWFLAGAPSPFRRARRNASLPG